MKKIQIIVIAFLIFLLLNAFVNIHVDAKKPTRTPTPTVTPKPTLTPTPSPTLAPTPSSTPTPSTPFPTASPLPITTPTLTPTPSPTANSTSTPTPTPTPIQTPTLPPNPTLTPTPLPTPTPTAVPTKIPAPSPNPSLITVEGTTNNGAIVYLSITGNVTSSQISNIAITTNQSDMTITVSFIITGESGTTGFSNMTIPKSAIANKTTTTIYIDNQPAQNQGYTQDADNYYIWYTTSFSTHQVSIQFTILTIPIASIARSSGNLLFVCIIIPEIILAFTVVASRKLRRKPQDT